MTSSQIPWNLWGARYVAVENNESQSHATDDEDQSRKLPPHHENEGCFGSFSKNQLMRIGVGLLCTLGFLLGIKALFAEKPCNATCTVSRLSPVAQVAIVPIIFQEDLSMVNLTDKDAVEDVWHDFRLPAGGFVHVNHPEHYSLLPNRDVIRGTTNIYMMSVFHQLHCLKNIQKALVELQDLDKSNTEGQRSGMPRAKSTDTPDEKFARVEQSHIEHCFAYLKQSILCAGDTTLEGPDKAGRGLHGWGVEHQCREWEGKNGLKRWAAINGVL